MVIVLKQNPDGSKVEQLMKRLRGMGLDIHQSQGKSSTILGLVGDTSAVDIDALSALDIVETVKRIQEPYKSANRKFHPNDSVIEVSRRQNRRWEFCGYRRALFSGIPRTAVHSSGRCKRSRRYYAAWRCV